MDSKQSKQARRLDQLDTTAENLAHVLNNWPKLPDSKRYDLIRDLLVGIINPELTASGMLAYELIDHTK